MKNLNKTLVALVVMLSPLISIAQPTEYVKDNTTRTVVPIRQNPVITFPSKTVNTTIITNTSTTTFTPKPQPQPVVVQTVMVSSKSVAEPIEESLALMRFETKVVHFGTVKIGEHPSHTFYFKNSGQEPVEIEIVSACDCTDVEYSRAPIPVGGTGFIKATYISERAPEAINSKFDKEITIVLKNKYADTGYPMVETLKIQGNVIE